MSVVPERVIRIAGAGLVLVALTTMAVLWPTQSRVDRIIDERLAERGLAPLPVPSGSASVASSASAVASSSPGATSKTDPVAASSVFLGRLDELMKDYKPELPVVEDKADVLRCITSEARNTPEVRQAVAALQGKADAAKLERKRREAEFYNALYPLAFHYDVDWQTRKGPAVSAAYGCWDSAIGDFTLASKLGNATSQACAQLNKGYQDWQQHQTAVWKQMSASRAPLFVYSNSETPPSQPPELMRRMDAAGVKTPPRFACRVDDVLPGQDHHIIKCHSAGPASPASSLRVLGILHPVNVGDVVSVPLAGTRRDPDGVLFKNVGGKAGGWVVDADAATLTTDVAATCPSMQDIQAAISSTGTR
jgi:hypothetical protein